MLLDSVLRVLARRRCASILAVGVATVGLSALAACGQAGSGPSASGSGRPVTPAVAARLTLCADPAAVSRVQIVVIPPLGQLPSQAKGGRRLIKITVTDPAKARTLARAVCDLPDMPKGVFHCPASFGGGYQLTFTAGGRRLPVVNVQAGGCERVTGAGGVRWAARTPGFWAVLGRIAGVRAIAHSP
ncbi:MAG TPA: hypothetical protein VN840_08050 [Streptosporangiaceae bacterium]|nr:hypothetical protein [Streptosporangiaceae bacterium]